MKKFTIKANGCLSKETEGFYNRDYIGFKRFGNPDFINHLKNTFNNSSNDILDNSVATLYIILKEDLRQLKNKYGNITICVVPRAKAENTYTKKQLLFKHTIKKITEDLNLNDGTDYIVRYKNTKTTHLSHSNYAGDGSMPYKGIAEDTCYISDEVKGKNILLIDDIYTKTINIDEDMIETLYKHGIFYAVAKTIKRGY